MLAYALLDANSAGWGSTKIVGLLAVAVALFGAFIVIELRSEAPLVPFRVFRLRTLTGANIVATRLIGGFPTDGPQPPILPRGRVPSPRP